MATESAATSTSFVPDWTFADKFRKARAVSGMEQREFAAQLELTASTVAAYETGRSAPRFRDAAALAKRIQLLTQIDYRWFLDTDLAPVGPVGLEPTRSTVEIGRFAEVLPFRRSA